MDPQPSHEFASDGLGGDARDARAVAIAVAVTVAVSMTVLVIALVLGLVLMVVVKVEVVVVIDVHELVLEPLGIAHPPSLARAITAPATPSASRPARRHLVVNVYCLAW